MGRSSVEAEQIGSCAMSSSQQSHHHFGDSAIQDIWLFFFFLFLRLIFAQPIRVFNLKLVIHVPFFTKSLFRSIIPSNSSILF